MCCSSYVRNSSPTISMALYCKWLVMEIFGVYAVVSCLLLSLSRICHSFGRVRLNSLTRMTSTIAIALYEITFIPQVPSRY